MEIIGILFGNPFTNIYLNMLKIIKKKINTIVENPNEDFRTKVDISLIFLVVMTSIIISFVSVSSIGFKPKWSHALQGYRNVITPSATVLCFIELYQRIEQSVL